MARADKLSPRPALRFPHTRGDGPCGEFLIGSFLRISPHPWGWPELGRNRNGGAEDFPTPVGMARTAGTSERSEHRFPHTRGDGPQVLWPLRWMFSISPHPWGWPGQHIAVEDLHDDFPTPVGMARFPLSSCFIPWGFPHTRGDGPPTRSASCSMEPISPHPWGWPVTVYGARLSTLDFPTPVGMARVCGRCLLRCYGFPHTRGDGPPTPTLTSGAFEISPHPWGWPAGSPSQRNPPMDFPTPVGMAREPRWPRRSGHGFPHTRGDGPRLLQSTQPQSPISPHPWGWPGSPCQRPPRRHDFPTPVGMARLGIPLRCRAA